MSAFHAAAHKRTLKITLAFVNTKYTMWFDHTKALRLNVLTNDRVLPTDEDMKNEILHMRLSADEKLILDDLRKAEPDLPTKSEMVRRLILRADKKLKAKTKDR